MNATTHERIFVAKPSSLDRALLQKTITAFDEDPTLILPRDQETATRFIQAFLPDFVVVTNEGDQEVPEPPKHLVDEAAAAGMGR